MIIIADKIAIGFARAHLLQGPFLAHFENTRRRHKNFCRTMGGCWLRWVALGVMPSANSLDGIALLLGILKLAVHRLYSAAQGRFKLRQTAHQSNQFRVADCWWPLDR